MIKLNTKFKGGILKKIEIPVTNSTNEEIAFLDKNEMYSLNGNNKKIFVIKSRVKNPIANVVIVPAYGKNSHGSYFLSHYLVSNSVNVIRFDGVNNVGLSSGNIINYSLGQLEEDLNRVLDELPIENDLPLILLSLSISFPVALKYTTYKSNVSKLISIVGSVDVARTIENVLGKSLKCYYENKDNKAPDIQTVFGHDVLIKDFFNDAEKNKYKDIENTITYLKETKSEINMIVGGRDKYVDFDDVLKCKKYFNKHSKMEVLKDATHEIGRSQSLKKQLACKIVEFLVGNGSTLNRPTVTEIIESSSIEVKFLNICERLISDNLISGKLG